MNTTARIVVGPGTSAASCYIPYELRHIVRSIPSRRWDATRKLWTIEAFWIDTLADGLRQAGCQVFVTNSDGTPWTSGRPKHGHRDQPAPDWIEAAFAACPPGNLDRLKKGLLAAFHPDRNNGTTTEVAQKIVLAHQTAEKRRPR